MLFITRKISNDPKEIEKFSKQIMIYILAEILYRKALKSKNPVRIKNAKSQLEQLSKLPIF